MPRQDTMPDFPVQDGVRFAHIAGFPGRAVSDDGRVWVCVHQSGKGFRPTWKQSKCQINRHGYCRVGFNRNGATFNFEVQRLVLTAFVGPAPEGTQACHNNGIRSDNRLANLRWDTLVANQRDRIPHGTYFQGSASPVAKLTEEAAQEIRQKYKRNCRTNGLNGLARQYGVTMPTVWKIVNGRNWCHV